MIQCDLPQAMNKLTEQADGINWELEEIRKTLPELKPHIDLTPVQQSLTEMQRSLTEMNKLLERVGNLSEKYSSKWIDWLPDFSLLVALKWIMLVLILGTAALAGWYGARRSAACSSDPRRGGLTAVGTLIDEDEDAEEKRRRMEAKIAAEKFRCGARLRRRRGSGGERKLDEQAVQEKQQQTMEGSKNGKHQNWTSDDIRSPSATATGPTVKKSARQRPSKSQPAFPSAASGGMSLTPPRSWSAASRPATPRMAK